MEAEQLIQLTADIVAAHVANNRVSSAEVGELIAQVHGALSQLEAGAAEPAAAAERKVPVVAVKASVRPDYLVCLECGRKQKTLKRHLATAHGLTPDQYRSEYRLPDSYPMVSPDYASRRREMALKIGLGQNGRGRAKPAEPAAAKVRGRRSKR